MNIESLIEKKIEHIEYNKQQCKSPSDDYDWNYGNGRVTSDGIIQGFEEAIQLILPSHIEDLKNQLNAILDGSGCGNKVDSSGDCAFWGNKKRFCSSCRRKMKELQDKIEYLKPHSNKHAKKKWEL